MSTKRGLQFIGAMSILRNVDSIGIPIFGTPGGNHSYVPEMDGNLRIMKYLIFHNREGYFIDRNIPTQFYGRIYHVRQHAPIPFWINRKCFVVGGEDEPEIVSNIVDQSGAGGDILNDIGLLLGNARSGYYIQEEEKAIADQISAIFSDIFNYEPSHSKYWVSRFHEASTYIRNMRSRRGVLSHRLDNIAARWVQLFGMKTDLPRLVRVIDGVISGDQREWMLQNDLFAFLVHKISSGQFSAIVEDIKRLNRFNIIFPYGIYQYYRENQWVKANFDYSKPFMLLDPLLDRIHSASNVKDYANVEVMSHVFFNKNDAPHQIINEIDKKLSSLKHRFDEMQTIYSKEYSKYEFYNAASDLLPTMLTVYKCMLHLHGAAYGNKRFNNDISADEFGIDRGFVSYLFDATDKM